MNQITAPVRMLLRCCQAEILQTAVLRTINTLLSNRPVGYQFGHLGNMHL